MGAPAGRARGVEDAGKRRAARARIARSRAAARARAPPRIRWRRKAHSSPRASERGEATLGGADRAAPVTRIGRARDAPELRHGERSVCAETTVCAFARGRRDARRPLITCRTIDCLRCFGRRKTRFAIGRKPGSTIVSEIARPSKLGFPSSTGKNTGLKTGQIAPWCALFTRTSSGTASTELPWCVAWPVVLHYPPSPAIPASRAPRAEREAAMPGLFSRRSHGGDRWVFPYRTRAVARADARGRGRGARDMGARKSLSSRTA